MDKVYVVSVKYESYKHYSLVGVYDSLEAMISANTELSQVSDEAIEKDNFFGLACGNPTSHRYRIEYVYIKSLDNMFKFSKNAKPRKLLHIKRLVNSALNDLNKTCDLIDENWYYSDSPEKIKVNLRQAINVIDMMLEPTEEDKDE